MSDKNYPCATIKTIGVKALTIKDKDDLLALQNHPDNICSFQDNIEDFLENFGYFYGAFLNNKLIGCCTIGGVDGVIEGAHYDDILLSNVFILPEYRGKNYGYSFIRLMCLNIKANIYITPLPGTEKFYEKIGFKHTENKGLMYICCKE